MLMFCINILVVFSIFILIWQKLQEWMPIWGLQSVKYTFLVIGLEASQCTVPYYSTIDYNPLFDDLSDLSVHRFFTAPLFFFFPVI